MEVEAKPYYLSKACEAFLLLKDMSAHPCDGFADLVEIVDGDGDLVVTVTKSISEYDLRSIIRHGTNSYECGKKVGRLEVQESMRKALGI